MDNNKRTVLNDLYLNCDSYQESFVSLLKKWSLVCIQQAFLGGGCGRGSSMRNLYNKRVATEGRGKLEKFLVQWEEV